MKKVLLLIITVLISFSLSGQETLSKSKAERKAERKLEKEKIEKEMMVNTEKAITTGHFVLKANQLRNKYGNVIMVNSSINFVAVKGRDVYVQFGTESGLGYNGVGGLTIRGTVTEYELTRDKSNSGYSLLLVTNGTFGSLTINIHSNVRGDIADAKVQSNWGSQLTFSGEIVPVVGSHVFQGAESY